MIAGDAYSFGITLLEMFTGRAPTDDMFREGLSLHLFAEMAYPSFCYKNRHLVLKGNPVRKNEHEKCCR